MKAKKSGRLLCEEPIQIFWHSWSVQRPRPDSQVPIPGPSSHSHSHDPRLAQTRFETSQQVGNEQGQGGGFGRIGETAKNYPPMFQAGRKRPADVAGLETGREGRGGGGGGGGEGREGAFSGGKKSIWERLGGKEGEKKSEQSTTVKV